MRTAKNLYLFQPSVKWTYCGGAALICAESIDDAIAIGNACKNEKTDDGRNAWLISETDENDPGFQSSEPGGVGAWVLVQVFELANDRPVGLVFTNANYA